MLRNTVEGLNKLFQKDIPQGFVILVTGVLGSLKSGFVHTILAKHLANSQEFGVYATLEEPKKSHLRNMRSLGIKIINNLQIFDYSDIRREWKGKEDLEMIKITEEIIKFYKERKGEEFTCFALDSLNVLHSLVRSPNLRRENYHFFSTLRRARLTSFITLELPLPMDYTPEYFLSDGVIEVGVIESHEAVLRYIQVKKMRAVNHRMEKYQMVVMKDGIHVLEPVYE